MHSVQNRIPVTAEDPEALPQHKKLRWLYNTSCVHGLGHCALKPLLSGKGGEKQHFGEQSRQEGEKLLRFQAHVLGETAPAGTLGKSPQLSSPWNMQLP